ncbi:GNAT family N-acetyltransferase [Sutcliffiella rhizosphaerae]|uniref:Mycothiol acetyltransferase n=1 Tax=Sutcliffiella rhizosphaerae TaxID=2880967 RepID=A0ABN8A5U5_9BACI|nr:GNAT family N-acetyltransferase [Sutcliffiella rhizosphaerae]CAG9620484.1 Mycothiol acetyltransferase [Sutcliffiella rhizosphaerae]
MRIKKVSCLTQEEYSEVVELLSLCEQHDKLEISASINLSTLKKADDGQHTFFLAYEKEVLTSFLGMYSFVDPKKLEVAGMVHPAYRNQGKFSSLLKLAKKEASVREVDELLYVCPVESESAKIIVKKQSAVYSFSEFTMEYRKELHLPPYKNFDLSLNIALQSDVQIVSKLLIDGFGFGSTDEYVANLVKRNISQPGYELYLVTEKSEPIATATISNEGDAKYISAFTVVELKRGKGYGRAVLEELIKLVQTKEPAKPLRLDVDVKNELALKLYEDSGFRTTSGYDYYIAK